MTNVGGYGSHGSAGGGEGGTKWTGEETQHGSRKLQQKPVCVHRRLTRMGPTQLPLEDVNCVGVTESE